MPDVASPRAAFPRLIVRDADAAIGFFEKALGARLIERFAEPGGRVAFARLASGDFTFSLSEEVPEWGWTSPITLGGSPVLMQLDLDDCDAVAARMEAEGAEIVIPIKDRSYGKREGRLRDPFGHLWILSQELTT